MPEPELGKNPQCGQILISVGVCGTFVLCLGEEREFRVEDQSLEEREFAGACVSVWGLPSS